MAPLEGKRIVLEVHDAVMHHLEQSWLFGTTLWPNNGFSPGHCHEKKIEDRIWVGISNGQTPETGCLWFCKVDKYEPARSRKQFHALKIIFHQSIIGDNIYIEDQGGDASIMRDTILCYFTIQ